MVEMNQNVVDQYFKGWIGVSVYNTDNYEKGPSCLILSFNTLDDASSSYEFLREWKVWNAHLPLVSSVVNEGDNKYSRYLYKSGRSEFIKAVFEIRKEEIADTEKFLRNENHRTYVLLPRFTDKSGQRIDSYTKDVFTLKGFRLQSRAQAQGLRF